jgi:CRISPR type I-E-associated protein CasB/Cse2
MTSTASTSPFVWERYARSDDASAKRRLVVAARKANMTEPGAEPDLWPLYRTEESQQSATAEKIRWSGPPFTAEHLTIGLWGIHQQGETSPVHNPKRSLGAACRGLFDHTFNGDAKIHSPTDTFGEDRVTKRLAALCRAETQQMAARQMASLIRLVKSTGAELSLDYAQVFKALQSWSNTEIRGSYLRRWSADYYGPVRTETKKPESATTGTPNAGAGSTTDDTEGNR